MRDLSAELASLNADWRALREYVPTLFDLEAVDAEQEAAA